VWRRREIPFEVRAMRAQCPEPPLGRLDTVSDYLTYLVETGLLSGDVARRTLFAASILRAAIREEARRANAEVD
jgi:hypothetical protein